MANVNDPYSQSAVTPAQRGRQVLGPNDGNAFDAFSAVEAVENAHDQQGAPDSLLSGPLVNNGTPLTPAPIVDRGAEYVAPRETVGDHILYDYGHR